MRLHKETCNVLNPNHKAILVWNLKLHYLLYLVDKIVADNTYKIYKLKWRFLSEIKEYQALTSLSKPSPILGLTLTYNSNRSQSVFLILSVFSFRRGGSRCVS